MAEQDPVARNVRARLDETVVNIELTLISIIQAVPLGILVDKVAAPLIHLEWQILLYLCVGLLTIFLFWSRALIHTLSFIGWPLDFTHNFLYIFSTLVQSVVLTQINNPQGWFGMWSAYMVVLWVMYAVDLRMIRAQYDAERNVNDKLLLRDVLDDQLLNVRWYIPLAFAFSLAAWWSVSQWPDFFVAGGWHLAIVTIQLGVGIAYLAEGYSILRRRNERILKRNVDAVE